MAYHSSKSLQSYDDFERFFREASAIAFNIQCLEGILKPLSEGDGAYLKPMIGEMVTLNRNENLPTKIALSWQIIHGISIFKPLAAELYLKALISGAQQVPPKVHNLMDLFDKLNPESQLQLNELFAKCFELKVDPNIPHIQLPNIRAVMEAHKNDFTRVRYGEAVQDYLRRTQDGMANINAAVDALRLACLLHPGAAGWIQTQPQVLEDEF